MISQKLRSRLLVVFFGMSLWAVASDRVDRGAFQTAIRETDLDSAAFEEWVDGHEGKFQSRVPPDPADLPNWVVWTADNPPQGWSGRPFGATKTAGLRHMRLGFTALKPVGAILVVGNVKVSVLRPSAAYPGNMADESLWIPAQRLLGGKITTDETVRKEECVTWLLPADTQTRAIRFTHTSREMDRDYAGWLGGAYILAGREANVAPQARMVVKASSEKAAKLNNESYDNFWCAWDNFDVSVGESGRVRTIVEEPETVTAIWPRPVTLDGLAFVFTGFSSGEIQIFKGPESLHPRDAGEEDWETIKMVSGLTHYYCRPLGISMVDLGRSVTTRALRVKMTAPIPADRDVGGHLEGNTVKGKRVWLSEFMAFHRLGQDSLESALPPPSEPAAHPPIPVKFTLPEAGFATLVIEDKTGKRVRNLVSETPFPAGENVVWWDGTDDLGRDVEAARHGLYLIPSQLVAPGDYVVRGLWRKVLHLSYEFNVYNNGNPPWNLSDHTGAWLANHCPPMSALYLPALKSPTQSPVVMLGAYVTEGTDGLIWVDLNGKKMGGCGWIGGQWTAAPYLARDDSPGANPKVEAYVASVGADDCSTNVQLRVTAFRHDMANSQKSTFLYAFPAPPLKQGESVDWNKEIGGLAVYNDLAVCSLTRANTLILADGNHGSKVGEVSLESPRGSVFDGKGRLLVLSGRTLLRFEPLQGAALSQPHVVVNTGLEDPVGLAVDAAGTIYISDRGASHQVKVFSGEGQFVRAIGRTGSPKAGSYDPLHMNNPRGLAVDCSNQVWVTEEDRLPKRTSVWSPEGKLLKAFYGPPKYGGGGTLDPVDKTRFYYADEVGTLEFKLDWEKGAFELANVPYRPGPEDLKLPEGFGSAPPEGVLYRERPWCGLFKKRDRYFTECFNNNPTSGGSLSFLFKDEKGIGHPVVGIGVANYWAALKDESFKTHWPEGVVRSGNDWNNQVFFVWSDLNDDRKIQPDEVVFRKATGFGITFMPDFSICVASLSGKAMRFSPVGFTDGGVPRYNLAGGEVLATNVQPPASSGGAQALADGQGNAVVTLGIGPFSPYSVCGASKGVATWSYPSLWPGLHASHESPAPDRPGELIGTTRLLGGFVKPVGGEAGPVWALTTSMGSVYLFTSDGLFIGTPFNDCRVSPGIAMPVARRGMSFDNLSLGGENFWPTMTQAADGKIYLVNGNDSLIIRMEGLESVKRFPPCSLTVTDEDLRKAQDYRVAVDLQRKREQGGGVLHVAMMAPTPVVDGQLGDWDRAEWVEIDKRGTAAFFDSSTRPYDIRGAVTVADGKMFAAWKTGQPELLKNSGEMPIAPFKTGGTLELMIAADPKADAGRASATVGDMRLTVTRVGPGAGKTWALLYRPVVPGSSLPKVPFSSPWRTITFDQVEDVSDKVQLAADGKGNYEVSVPLDVLGLHPQPGMRIQGDIGFLRGDGARTVARTYWSNKATAIVSDVPSEAELLPSLWGVWEFVQQDR